MSNFNEIMVGDKVLIRIGISYGWHESRYFNIAVSVEKTTPTQFIAGGKRFKKDTGKEIGEHFSSACKIGEKTNFGQELVDETKDYIEFKSKVVKAQALANYFYELRKYKVSDLLNLNSDEFDKFNCDIANLIVKLGVKE